MWFAENSSRRLQKGYHLRCNKMQYYINVDAKRKKKETL